MKKSTKLIIAAIVLNIGTSIFIMHKFFSPDFSDSLFTQLEGRFVDDTSFQSFHHIVLIGNHTNESVFISQGDDWRIEMPDSVVMLKNLSLMQHDDTLVIQFLGAAFSQRPSAPSAFITLPVLKSAHAVNTKIEIHRFEQDSMLIAAEGTGTIFLDHNEIQYLKAMAIDKARIGLYQKNHIGKADFNFADSTVLESHDVYYKELVQQIGPNVKKDIWGASERAFNDSITY